jgi:hypothetical protein
MVAGIIGQTYAKDGLIILIEDAVFHGIHLEKPPVVCMIFKRVPRKA